MRPFSLHVISILLLLLFPATACRTPEPLNLTGENIICFGDSLTFGTGAPPGAGYPDRLSEMIQARDALVVIGGLKVLFWDRGYAEGYEELAAETGALLVPDILGGLMGNKDLMHDTIHPNGAGYEIMAQKFYEAVKPYL